MTKKCLLALSLSTGMGCTKSIDDTTDSGLSGTIACADSVDGVTTTVIDSTSHEDWIYMDFELCEVVSISEPEQSSGWDIGFQRFNPKINGGVSGSAEMEVAILTGTDFDALSAAPEDGYVTDAADADDDGIPEYAMAGWFDYNQEDHTLSPADIVYVLKTVEGGYVKLQFEDYYDEAGTSGVVQFSWAFIDVPGSGDDGGSSDGTGTDGGGEDDGGEDGGGEDGGDSICAGGTDLVTTETDGADNLSVFQSGESEDWVCFSFGDSTQVDSGWDIAWKTYDITLASDISGMVLEGEDYAALTSVPEGDWVTGNTDLMDDWFDYSGSPDHLVTPKDHVYVLEDADGQFWKIQITTYYLEGVVGGEPRYPTIRWASLPSGA